MIKETLNDNKNTREINKPWVLQNVDPDLPPLASHVKHRERDRMNLKRNAFYHYLLLLYCGVTAKYIFITFTLKYNQKTNKNIFKK